MRTISLILIISVSITLLFLPDAAISSSTKMDIAVVEFDVKGNLQMEDAGINIAEWMIQSATKTQEFTVKEKVLLKKVLDEQGIHAYGFIYGRTALKIGALYGVKGIIIGSAVKVGDVISLKVRLMDTNLGHL
jgi:hypothetical protein